MGFLDRLVGGGSSKGKEQQVPAEEAAAPVAAAAPPSSPELEHQLPDTSYGPPKLDMSAGLSPSIPSLTGLSMPDAAPSGRMYDPYEGISAAVTGRKHVFKLPTQPEFVFDEEAVVKRRGWNENLQFYTGIGYLSGGVTGVSAGMFEFVTKKPEFPTDTLKLKANRILNLLGSRAKPFSNSAAIMGLYFSSLESYLSSQLDRTDIPEQACTVGAGALTGALYRSPRGPRQAVAAGLVGAVAGVGVLALRTVFPSL